MTTIAKRKSAIHLLRAGKSTAAVAEELEMSKRWVRKWRVRFQAHGWEGLQDASKRPHHLAHQLKEEQRQAIRQARSELEAEAASGQGLKYIGGQAVRTRLKEKGVDPLPSRALSNGYCEKQA